jgi:hypothetical protein
MFTSTPSPHHGIGGRQTSAKAITKKEEAINAWAEQMTLNTVFLNAESNGVVSINGLGINVMTMVHLRRFCVMFRIAGYKNKKREETIQLIVRRMRSEAIEKAMYPEDADSEDISQGRTHAELPLEDNGLDEEQQECYSSTNNSNSDSVLVAPSGDVPGVVELQETLSPTTRAMLRAAELQAASKAKKRSKSAPPSSITQEGSYY